MELGKSYANQLKERFKLDSLGETAQETIEAIGRKRGCLAAGGTVDIEKTYKLILKDYREGKIGAISLDHVEEIKGSRLS
jgi:ribosome biogenesis GTPase A